MEVEVEDDEFEQGFRVSLKACSDMGIGILAKRFSKTLLFVFRDFLF